MYFLVIDGIQLTTPCFACTKTTAVIRNADIIISKTINLLNVFYVKLVCAHSHCDTPIRFISKLKKIILLSDNTSENRFI